MVLLKEAHGRSDADLAEQCRDGDDAAFDELVHRHKDRVYRVVYRFLGNHDDARDVAQEAFVRAYHNMRNYSGQASMATWLLTIASNLARNRLRDQHRKGRDKGVSLEALAETAPGVPPDGVIVHDTPRSAAEFRELEENLEKCLAALPDTHRLVFALRVFDGLCYEEIAECADCAEGTVKSRLNQARRRLGECLRARGVI